MNLVPFRELFGEVVTVSFCASKDGIKVGGDKLYVDRWLGGNNFK